MYSSIHFQSKPRTTTNASKPEVIERLRHIVGAENVLVEPEQVEPYGADAVKEKFPPEAVVFPRNNRRNVPNSQTRQRIHISRHGRGAAVSATPAAQFRLTAALSSELTE